MKTYEKKNVDYHWQCATTRSSNCYEQYENYLQSETWFHGRFGIAFHIKLQHALCIET
jgi:hypothetical protein